MDELIFICRANDPETSFAEQNMQKQATRNNLDITAQPSPLLLAVQYLENLRQDAYALVREALLLARDGHGLLCNCAGQREQHCAIGRCAQGLETKGGDGEE